MLKNGKWLGLASLLLLVGCDGLKKESKPEKGPAIDKAALDKPAEEPAKKTEAPKEAPQAPAVSQQKAPSPKEDIQEPAASKKEAAEPEAKVPEPATDAAEPVEVTSPDGQTGSPADKDKAAPVEQPASSQAPSAPQAAEEPTSATKSAKSAPAPLAPEPAQATAPETAQPPTVPTESAVDKKEAPKDATAQAAKPAEGADAAGEDIRKKVTELGQLANNQLAAWIQQNVATREMLKAGMGKSFNLKDPKNAHYIKTSHEFLASVVQSLLLFIRGYDVISVQQEKSNKSLTVYRVALKRNAKAQSTEGLPDTLDATVIVKTKGGRLVNVLVQETGLLPLVQAALQGVCTEGVIDLEKWNKEIGVAK
ncbi:MAG: hypothetical protein LBF66_03245 [Holosporales bacterium]|jgi:hypothetical protein|nr:hypothetical protein [Holosporales bacterium]